MYHGILIDQEFGNKSFPESFKCFAKKQDGSWGIFGIEIDDSKIQETINKIQEAMKGDQPWYVHLYNDDNLIVIFKNNVFTVKPHISSWSPIIEFGRQLNIPEAQLDFWPNRFQDEKHYFESK